MRSSGLLIATLFGVFVTPNVRAGFINFDDVPAGIKAGNIYASQGVSFSTVNIPNAVAVNDIVTLTGVVDGFQILASDSRSAPNVAVSRDLSLSDVLMTFTQPVTNVTLDLDGSSASEIGANDIIRLIALESTGNPNEFRILGFSQTVDSSLAPLSLSLGGSPFSFALFQVTSELEGVDNLSFTAVPEPASVVLMGVGILGLLGLELRRRVHA